MTRLTVSVSLLVAAVAAQGGDWNSGHGGWGGLSGNGYPPASWSSIDWWPGPPWVTETSGPISPHYSKPPATTSLTGSIPSYTYTSPPGYSSATPPTATVTPNANSTSLGGNSSLTGNGTLPACKKIQYDFPSGQGSNAERAQAVKDAYLYAWNAYAEYAFGKDELQPLNASGVNDWYGWVW